MTSADLMPTLDFRPAFRNHAWNYLLERKVPACETSTGCDQTERPCKHCSVIKITVHAPDNRAWNEWRHKNSVMQVTTRPPCLEVVSE